MPSDRPPAAQLPFWPGPTLRDPTRAEKRELRKVAKPETPAARAVRERLQERLSARVALKDNGGRGTFTVHYASYEALDEIMRRIKA